ncbi:cobalt-zinc-cadmium efflux system protein [Stackebrandtia albiflava]|uniref:Cobalt-zinc-cadmium efflux system protein n=1 Tax=Stackebrandtia albiflava TaxID=406432 RepID=A0A562VH58_9ACTN|nr:cation diffusion facilitator family transporter [Stackebrandtia albiflava]TWJ17190.1 cobalt-zinc-cadmium efflux system protein [Stackebrandtia albiflava]
MGAGHDHGAMSLGARHRGRLWAALGVTGGFMVVEIVMGLFSNSLALLSDAGHMATDALGIAMALAAIIAVRRSRSRPRRTFGLYRLEVLAALGNTVLLFAVAVWVLIESVGRFREPTEVASTAMLVTAVVGLIANLVSLGLLRSGASESINVRGAYFEVLGDVLGSIGVIVAAVVIATTGWWYADPVIAVAMAGLILPRAARLGRDALRILLQTAPEHIDVPAVEERLRTVPGVTDVHDLHVWTLTSGMDVASAHLGIASGHELGGVLSAARSALHEDFGIDHATLQVEPQDDRGCESLTW